MARYKVLMVRVGESGKGENFYSGWSDVRLTEKGTEDALNAGDAIRAAGINVDMIFTSTLMRANNAVHYIMQSTGKRYYQKTWCLNGRHYGAITAYLHDEAVEQYGAETVNTWVTSYDVAPLPIEHGHTYFNRILQLPNYKNGPPRNLMPFSESLKDVVDRATPYWINSIIPKIKTGRNILIVGHGSSLRAIVKYMDQLTDEQICSLNLPTGVPITYTVDENFRSVASPDFLGDPENVKKATEVLVKTPSP